MKPGDTVNFSKSHALYLDRIGKWPRKRSFPYVNPVPVETHEHPGLVIEVDEKTALVDWEGTALPQRHFIDNLLKRR